MKTQENPLVIAELPLFDPIAILTEELKNKTIKKQAVQEIQTIALTLTPKQMKEELVPLLIKTFVQENTEMRIELLRSFVKIADFMDNSKSVYSMLEFIIDVLCVFSEAQIRKEAFSTLNYIMKAIDLKACSMDLKQVIQQLSKETEKNIMEVLIRLVRYLFQVADQEEYLLTIIKMFTKNSQHQYLLVQELKEFIKMIPLFPLPEVDQIIKETIQSSNSKSKCKIIESVLLLATLEQSHQMATNYILALFKDSDSDVIASLILQVKIILEVFPFSVQECLWKIVDSFQSQNLTIKTAIIEVLELIPLTEQRRSMVLNSHNINKALNLSKTLANSLCKMQDLEALKVIIQNSDNEFKNKLFPKLPPTCELHVSLMENLFTQKNWRNKLTLLQNIEKRLQEGEKVQIFLPKLLQQMGDKIAVFRMAVVKLIATILNAKRISLMEVYRQFDASLNSKNWFERQSAFLLLQERASQFDSLNSREQDLIKKAVRQGALEKIQNIKQIACSIKEKCKIKTDD